MAKGFNVAKIETTTATTTSLITSQGGGTLKGMFVSTVASAPQVTIYDNTSASGKKLVASFVATVGFHDFGGMTFKDGLFVSIDGTLPSADISLLWSQT